MAAPSSCLTVLSCDSDGFLLPFIFLSLYPGVVISTRQPRRVPEAYCFPARARSSHTEAKSMALYRLSFSPFLTTRSRDRRSGSVS